MRYRFFPLPSDIYFMTHVPIHLSIVNFLIVSIPAVLVSLLAAVIPSRIAARLDPIRLIRFGS